MNVKKKKNKLKMRCNKKLLLKQTWLSKNSKLKMTNNSNNSIRVKMNNKSISLMRYCSSKKNSEKTLHFKRVRLK